MEKLKRILHMLLFPHIAITLLIVPIAAALLIYVFTNPMVGSKTAYGAYFLSAYALTILCTGARWIYRRITAFKDENKYIKLYLNDVHIRAKISLYASLGVSIAYAVFQLALGVYHKTVWFYSLAVYYALLAVVRYFLLRDMKSFTPGENRLHELKRYRFCGIVLVPVNLALAVIVFYITWQSRTFVHHYITTIAMAAYTFTALTIAIVNVVKYKKFQSPVLSAAKIISLASAAVSVLTLETAMLTAFSEKGQELFRRIMTMLTGTAVCLFVLVMAVYMIVKSTKEIHSERTA